MKPDGSTKRAWHLKQTIWSIHSFLCRTRSLSIYLSIYLSIHPSIYLSIYIYYLKAPPVPKCLCVCLCVYMSYACLNLSLSLSPKVSGQAPSFN